MSSKSGSSSSNSAKISTQQVQRILESLNNQQTRQSTTNNYLSIWRNFNKFLLRLDKKVTGSWEERVALFGAHLISTGTKSSTLKSYFAAIKSILKRDGYQWDDNKVLLSALTCACKLKNDVVITRLPIQSKLLELLIF